MSGTSSECSFNSLVLPESLVTQPGLEGPHPVSKGRQGQGCSGPLGVSGATTCKSVAPLSPGSQLSRAAQVSPPTLAPPPHCLPDPLTIESAGSTHWGSLLTGQWPRLPSPRSPWRLLEPCPSSCKWKAICSHSQDGSLRFNCLSFCWHSHRPGCLRCLLAVCWQDTLPGPASHPEEKHKREGGDGASEGAGQ